MYRYTSNQTADRSQLLVELDLIRRGFVPFVPRSRDHIYDILVEREHEKYARPVHETIQVKTVSEQWTFNTTTRGHSNESRVSLTGKFRNNTAYADYCIDWIAAVDKDEQVHYYPLDVYREYKQIHIKKIPGVEFGKRDVPSHCVKTYALLMDDPSDKQITLDLGI